MFLQMLFIAAGLVLLAGGANLFVNAALGLSMRFGVPPLLVGVVLVGFATSAPELITGVLAALDGRTSIAVGNALGSNITNLSLVLGATALLLPFNVSVRAVRREYCIGLLAILLALAALWNGLLSRWDGLLLCGALLLILSASVLIRPGAAAAEPPEPAVRRARRGMSLPRLLVLFCLGLLLLLGGAQLLLSGAVKLAHWAGLSDLVIGLTVIAVGTSLPELAASLASAFKRETALSIGTILGSNTFNALGCIGLPALLHPTAVESAVLMRDFPIMAALTLLVGVFTFALGRTLISRVEGTVLLLCFLGYQGLLLLSALGATAS